jgi:hypothetical protein
VSVAATVVYAAVIWLLYTVLGIGHPMFSFCVHFGTMGWSTAVLTAWKPALANSWFDAKPFENGGRFYRRLGVLRFQSALRRIGWERITRGRGAWFGRGRESAVTRECESRYGELAHLVGVLAFPPLAIWMIAASQPVAIVYLAFWTIVLQVYPVMLQRYNRPRYGRVVDRQLRERMMEKGT